MSIDSKDIKLAVVGSVVKLLTHQRLDRGMILMPHASRCLRHGDIHELVTTDERDATAGDTIDRVGFLGFLEITRGGVVERGDAVRIDGYVIGRVLGFDDCHAPNHLNVIVTTDRLMTALSASLKLEDEIRFEAASAPHTKTSGQATPASMSVTESGEVI